MAKTLEWMRPCPTSAGPGGFDARFEGNARALESGRPSYPRELYRRILAKSGAARFDVAADLGCGAGHSLAGLFEVASEVRGVEPGEQLLELARRAYPQARISAGSGEETGLDSASVDLVTIGTALTWMDCELALREVHRILRVGCWLAVYAYAFPRIHGPADEVLQRHLREHWDAHRSDRLREPVDVSASVRASELFADCESFGVPHQLCYDPERLTRFLESTSFVHAFLGTHTDPCRYLAALTEELRVAGGSELEVDFSLQVVVARRSA